MIGLFKSDAVLAVESKSSERGLFVRASASDNLLEKD
jgi:hypothetical protein